MGAWKYPPFPGILDGRPVAANPGKGGPMRTVGLLGGMSWESTAAYYRIINERVKKAMGGLHSAKILMASVDFAELERL